MSEFNESGKRAVGREDPGYRPVSERLRDYDPVERRLDEAAVRRQASRCLGCGIPFCHGYGCPVANLIPDFNDLACRGRWAEALGLLLETNPFPEFTGRICPAPCETACVLGLHEPAVSIRQIELEIIEQGFALGLMRPRPPLRRLAQTVAIAGSGPAGLAAADRLNRIGYTVTVFENAPKPGGILRYGIPNFKLDKAILDRRLGLMVEEGVRFEARVELGEDVSRRFLEHHFDAVLLAGGAMQGRDLCVPGRELGGIALAMDFLTRQQLRLEGLETRPETGDELHAGGRNVVVIGGGDTGSDCIGTAWRQGARAVTQLELLPQPPETRAAETPWPQWPLQRRESSSHQEGGRRLWSVRTRRFLGDSESGRVAGVAGVMLDWTGRPAVPRGRVEPQEIPGSAFVLPADLVLLAMGFEGPVPGRLVEELALARDARGCIVRDARNMTSRGGVFVAGDMSRGASLVVRAIADGLRAAEHIHAWLGENPSASTPTVSWRRKGEFPAD